MCESVVLLGFWSCPFGLRVRIALAEKGVEFEYKEQYRFDKDLLLLQSNPVHRKIPVIILEYIDEVWTDGSPLLPKDPYQRTNARSWADYIDKKVYGIGSKIWKRKGEAKEGAKKEFIECLKLLEGELGDKPYFGGDTFGFVDVAFIPFSCWFYSYVMEGNFNLEEECPKLKSWEVYGDGECVEGPSGPTQDL